MLFRWKSSSAAIKLAPGKKATSWLLMQKSSVRTILTGWSLYLPPPPSSHSGKLWHKVESGDWETSTQEECALCPIKNAWAASSEFSGRDIFRNSEGNPEKMTLLELHRTTLYFNRKKVITYLKIIQNSVGLIVKDIPLTGLNNIYSGCDCIKIW